MKTTQQKPTSITVTLTPLVAIGLLMTAITPIFATKDLPAAQSSRPGLKVVTKTMNVSGYCACSRCCEGWSKVYPRRTANGHIIRPGDAFVAAPRGVAFGTIMQIPGYNGGRPVEVKDRGGAIKGNKLDLYFSTHKEALIWGRKQVKVRVYEVK